MEIEPTQSPNVIDHRKRAATHGISALLGIVLGWLTGRATSPPSPDPDADLAQVSSTALDRGGDFWSARVTPWRPAHEVWIGHEEPTPCGKADSTTGPFYCPTNERIYLDLSFLRAIPGDLARAYVTAHELGHHIQRLRGEYDGRSSVAIELEADCYAGLWMQNEKVNGHLAAGDVEAAMAEAEAVGDDRICPTCSIEQWTHGSAMQRAAALRHGLGGDCAEEVRAR